MEKRRGAQHIGILLFFICGKSNVLTDSSFMLLDDLDSTLHENFFVKDTAAEGWCKGKSEGLTDHQLFLLVDGQWLTFPFPFVHHQPLRGSIFYVGVNERGEEKTQDYQPSKRELRFEAWSLVVVFSSFPLSGKHQPFPRTSSSLPTFFFFFSF